MYLRVKNVNEAYYVGVNKWIYDAPFNVIETRGMRRMVYPVPWVTQYDNPTHRVLFDPVRDANPTFHLMDALWMLAGRNDTAWLAQWLPSVMDYSDNGVTFYGAYGDRMHEEDQLARAIRRLEKDPHSSRAVLALYHPADTKYHGRDMPCNCTVMFDIKNGALCMSVCNRSNDLLWGAYGANAVQFSVLQEYVAASLGVPVGTYTQFSHNTHIYPDTSLWCRILAQGVSTPEGQDRYSADHVTPVKAYPLVDNVSRFQQDLRMFMNETTPDMFFTAGHTYRNRFFTTIALPMALAHRLHKAKQFETRDTMLALMPEDADWYVAARQWYDRRKV